MQCAPNGRHVITACYQARNVRFHSGLLVRENEFHYDLCWPPLSNIVKPKMFIDLNLGSVTVSPWTSYFIVLSIRLLTYDTTDTRVKILIA